jgi:hypothetical protein
MKKVKRTSLESIFTGEVEDTHPSPSPAAAPAAPRPDEAPDRIAHDATVKKQTAYLKQPVYEQLRRLAFDERHKMHDYLIEGLDRVFRDRGLPSVAELEKEDA